MIYAPYPLVGLKLFNILYNTNSGKVQELQSYKMSIVEDDIKFTDKKVLSKTKIKGRPKSSITLHKSAKKRSMDGIIVRRATSLSSIEELFLIKRCPLIRPLLSETELLRFKNIRERCKAKKIDSINQEFTLQDNWVDFITSSALHGSEETKNIHNQLNLVREKDKKSELNKNIYDDVNFKSLTLSVDQEGKEKHIKSKINERKIPSGENSHNYPSHAVNKGDSKNRPQLSSKLVKEEKIVTRKTSQKNMSENKVSEIKKSNISKNKDLERNVSVPPGKSSQRKSNKRNDSFKEGSKNLSTKSSTETKNEKEQKSTPINDSSKNIENKSKLVKQSNKSGKQESERKSSASVIKTKNKESIKEGLQERESKPSRQNKRSNGDTRNSRSKLKHDLSQGDISIQRVKRSSEDKPSLSDKASDRTASKRLLKSNKNDSENSNDQNYNGNMSNDANSEQGERKLKQRRDSPSTRTTQGQDKDVAKSPKVNVTKQTPSSIKSRLAGSNEPFEKLANEKSKHHKKEKLSSIFEYVIQYVLSDPVFLKKGWTLKPVDKTLSAIVTFKTVPANPHTYCFRLRSEDEIKYYPNGNLAVNMRKDKTGEVYYPSGSPAIVLQMSSTGMRLVLYEDLKNNLSGKGRVPVRVIGVFDSFGNGVLFGEKGEKSLVFNQLKGIFNNPDKKLPYSWKWGGYKVLEKQRLKELLRSMVEENEKVQATVTKAGGKLPLSHKIGVNKLREEVPEYDPLNSSMLAESTYPPTKDKIFKKSNNSSIFKPILLKVNKEITLRINGQDKVVIQFWAEKVSYSLDLGIVVDPQGVERIDEVDPGKLSEVPCVLDDLLRPSPSLKDLRSTIPIKSKL